MKTEELTVEKRIPYAGNLSANCGKLFNLSHLTPDEVLVEKDASKILIRLRDDNGAIILLLEAISKNSEEDSGKRGCYITRFEYVTALVIDQIYKALLDKFSDVVLKVMALSLTTVPEYDPYKGRYQYVWAMSLSEQKCVIAEILGLKKSECEGVACYRRELSDLQAL